MCWLGLRSSSECTNCSSCDSACAVFLGDASGRRLDGASFWLGHQEYCTDPVLRTVELSGEAANTSLGVIQFSWEIRCPSLKPLTIWCFYEIRLQLINFFRDTIQGRLFDYTNDVIKHIDIIVPPGARYRRDREMRCTSLLMPYCDKLVFCLTVQGWPPQQHSAFYLRRTSYG